MARAADDRALLASAAPAAPGKNVPGGTGGVFGGRVIASPTMAGIVGGGGVDGASVDILSINRDDQKP